MKLPWILSDHVEGLPRHFRRSVGLLFLAVAACSSFAAKTGAAESRAPRFEWAQIPPGHFMRGNPSGGDADEQPVHRVNISQAFEISATEVTLAQYQLFRPSHSVHRNGKATGVSWHDAMAYCAWLSEQDGKAYRLPTEAEWEYSTRAGTTSSFWSGEAPPTDGAAPNPWGVRGSHDDVAEWCFDWYGAYREGVAVNPAGPDRGLAKVIRGSQLDQPDEKQRERPPVEYHSSANRAGIAPGFGVSSAGHAGNPFGNHNIGFRIVRASLPEKFHPATVPFVRQGVKRDAPKIETGPDASRPYFRKRLALPSPPDNRRTEHTLAAGLPASLRFHNHSPALVVCPNGDLLATYFSANVMNRELHPPPPWHQETAPGVGVIAIRLRRGAEQWEMPEMFWDFPDVNDGGPLMWTDEDRGGLIYFIVGNNRLPGAFPFQWATSADNGATWSEVHFPHFVDKVGTFAAQPINTMVKDGNGVIYVPLDAEGPTSVLMATRDNGQTWFDTGGRTGGRHTSFALLKDGRILGMGGKESGIKGFMPRSISADHGKTWEISATPFPRQGGNQRPSLLRLQSGRLFFAGDFQNIWGAKPGTVSETGAYVALSEDEGETWRIKQLPGVQRHESYPAIPTPGTIGYSIARQGKNGMIHLLTTMNEPNLHFEMNEAWILSEGGSDTPEGTLLASTTRSIRTVEKFRESFPDGKLKYEWSGGLGDDGRFLLHGKESWFFENGSRHYECTYVLGVKRGRETLWRRDGSKEWEWTHEENGRSKWEQYWENGKSRSVSHWRDRRTEGPARRWDSTGNVVSSVIFREGYTTDDKGAP